MANAIDTNYQSNTTSIANQSVANKTIANTIEEASKAVNSAKSNFKSKTNNVKKDPLYEILKSEYDKITSPKWINNDGTSPKDVFYGPKLWVAEAFPRNKNVELWEEASKFAAENGLHVAITETPFNVFDATISAYTQDGKFLGKVSVGPVSNLGIKEGIELLKQKIFMQNTPETITTQQTSNGGLLTNAINSIRNVFRVNKTTENNEETQDTEEPSIEEMIKSIPEEYKKQFRETYGNSSYGFHAIDEIKFLYNKLKSEGKI